MPPFAFEYTNCSASAAEDCPSMIIDCMMTNRQPPVSAALPLHLGRCSLSTLCAGALLVFKQLSYENGHIALCPASQLVAGLLQGGRDHVEEWLLVCQRQHGPPHGLPLLRVRRQRRQRGCGAGHGASGRGPQVQGQRADSARRLPCTALVSGCSDKSRVEVTTLPHHEVQLCHVEEALLEALAHLLVRASMM